MFDPPDELEPRSTRGAVDRGPGAAAESEVELARLAAILSGEPSFDVDRWELLGAEAAAADLSAVSDKGLMGLALAAERVRRSVDSLAMHALVELEARRVTDVEHGMRTVGWVAAEADLPTAVTKRQLTLGQVLRSDLPHADAALAQGRIGVDHAQVLARAVNPRIIDDFAALVPELVDLVPEMTFAAWAREVHRLAELLDADGPEPEADLGDQRISVRRDGANGYRITGSMHGEIGVAIEQCLNDRADQIFRRMVADEELTADLRVPPRGTLMLLALWEMTREAQGRTDVDGRPTGKAPRTELDLIVHADDPEVITDHHGVHLRDHERDCVTCDARFRPIVMNLLGVVLVLGREQRLVNRAQQRAIAVRDGGCVFPGCDRPIAWTDAHHVLHWKHGGLTDICNLAPLCRYHHGVSHREGWSMHVTADQWFWWETPSGDRFWSQRHGRQRAGPPPRAPARPGTVAA